MYYKILFIYMQVTKKKKIYISVPEKKVTLKK